MKRVRVTVSGRVQGVFFRATCARLARDAGLGGYVRNLPDGRLEAAFEGDELAVDAIVDWCRRGPDLALVDSFEAVPEDPVGDTTFGFRLRNEPGDFHSEMPGPSTSHC